MFCFSDECRKIILSHSLRENDKLLITKLQALESMGTKKEETDRLAQHIYDQAKLAHGSLDSEGLERFLKFNSELLAKSVDNI